MLGSNNIKYMAVGLGDVMKQGHMSTCLPMIKNLPFGTSFLLPK